MAKFAGFPMELQVLLTRLVFYIFALFSFQILSGAIQILELFDTSIASTNFKLGL